MSRLRTVLDMIKFRHSVFALPFALVGMLAAADGLPAWRTIFWIIIACVAARSMAMAYNRLADRDLDALNPRTSARALPAGLVSVGFTRLFVFLNAALFVLSSAMLNALCLALSPLIIVVLLGYSHLKRFTVAAHWGLGLALGLAPLGAWVAVRGNLDGLPLFLTAGVMFWTAGFDLIYACLDRDFDRGAGLYAIPSKCGAETTLRLSAWCHVSALFFFGMFLVVHGFGLWAWFGWLIVAALLYAEQRLVTPDDLNDVGRAFFTMNAWVGAAFLFGCSVDLFL